MALLTRAIVTPASIERGGATAASSMMHNTQALWPRAAQRAVCCNVERTRMQSLIPQRFWCTKYTPTG